MKLLSLRLVALVAAAALILTGCAKLPTSSEVKVGSDIQGGLTTDYLYYSPSGPSDGASQQEIINGFLNAATGPQNDYQVAREFLAGDLAAKWSPSKERLVGDTRPQIQMVGSTGARLSVRAVDRASTRHPTQPCWFARCSTFCSRVTPSISMTNRIAIWFLIFVGLRLEFQPARV